MDTIKINHPKYERPVDVSKDSFISAKWKDLKEFGYTTLTRDEVANQVEKILNGEKLSVIGMFMKNDIVAKNPAAVALRAIPSEKRARASRENGKKGGRPKKSGG